MQTAVPRSIVQRRQAGGLLFTKTLFEPHTVLGRHTHANAYISFVRAGSYTERVGHATRRCESSSLLLHAPGETHENRFHGERVQLLRIEAVASDLLAEPAVSMTGGSIRSERASLLCHSMLRELEDPDDLTPLALQGLAYELVAALARTHRDDASRGPTWLRRIDVLLIETFADPLDLTAMARTVNVHPVHLARTFRKYRGQTVGMRLRDLRLEQACRALVQSHATVGEIAHACGFADQSHLTRLMRRRMGTSPSRFRAANSVPRR